MTSNHSPERVTQDDLALGQEVVKKIVADFGQRVVGQAELMYALIAALFAKGNILLEGVPGLAKTRSVKNKPIAKEKDKTEFPVRLVEAVAMISS